MFNRTDIRHLHDSHNTVFYTASYHLASLAVEGIWFKVRDTHLRKDSGM